VTSLSPDLLLGGLAFAVDLLDERYLLETVAVRRMLEPPATAAAASLVRPDQLAFLRTLLEYMQASISDAETMIQYDMEFHRAVVSAAGNETLTTMLESLSSATIRARIWRGMVEADAAQRTMTEHQAIYDALAAGDPAVAHAAALIHVNTSEQWLRHLIVGDPRPAANVSPAR
jgi:GntR family transcriptional repressor for pyruvate dehydrogenase complex